MRSLLSFITMACILTACGWFEPRTEEPKDSMAEKLDLVREKRDLYCDLSRERVLSRGWAVAKCDGLLFTSLHAASCGYGDIEAFFDGDRPYRSPSHDCYPGYDNGADSTISKDMLAGFALYGVIKNDRDLLERFVGYCKGNETLAGAACKVGDAESDLDAQSKIFYPFTGLTVLEDYLGQNRLTELTAEKSGFEKHLEVMGILTRGAVYGAIKKSEKDKLGERMNESPSNAVYNAAYNLYADGNMEVAADLLLDESRWPSDSLPTSANHCSDYVYQRDVNPGDWEPCPDKKKNEDGTPVEHDGTAFSFAAAIMLGEIK